ncbi:MAG: PLP-dependent aminotransferase family protein [Clostridiales bacterium]|nr:PLP-dependent aminotransferase family protein [Clostridiales bacterium]
MLTYKLEKKPGLPLYESLYRCIRADILSGRLAPGEKLPSKRALAENLQVGKTTVEAAVAQLTAEGFLRSKEKVGYFVEALPLPPEKPPIPQSVPAPAETFLADLTSGGGCRFPFTAWSRLQRQVFLDYGEKLLQPLPNQGIPELRRAIAAHLADFRGMAVDPGNILVGAGTDFLYNLLIQLLGRDLVYAVEEPGYGKIRRVYAAAAARCVDAPMDSHGVRPDGLGEADVLHISPAHHFPTGIVTPLSRRQALLAWARAGGKWIIEDDYDSEFRFKSLNLPAMQSLDPEQVIYMNTFSKSLAPSIRISYMVLPPALMKRFQETLGFYSCTVASFEQYTLARFLSEGYFEKHINRMRKFYRLRRAKLTGMLAGLPGIRVLEQDAGLHFLVELDTALPDTALVQALSQRGVRAEALSSFYHTKQEDLHRLVVDYSGLEESAFQKAVEVLRQLAGSN